MRTLLLIASMAIVVSCAGSGDDESALTEETVDFDGSANVSVEDVFAVADTVVEQAQPMAVRIATQGNIPPFTSVRVDGSLHGIDINVGEAICRQADFDCVWLIVDRSELFTSLNAGKVDIAISAIPINDINLARVSLSDAYFSYQPGFMVAVDADILPDGLTGISVAIVRNNPVYRNAWMRMYGVEPISFPDITAALTALDDGEIHAVLHEQTILSSYQDHSRQLVDITSYGLDDLSLSYAVAIRKYKPDLLQKVNVALATLRQEGFFDQIYQIEDSP